MRVRIAANSLRNLILGLLVLCCQKATMAQSPNVAGTIRDGDGAPLSGVTIAEKGTNNATMSGSRGDFELQVTSSPASVLFTLVGYTAREVNLVPGQATEIILEPLVTELKNVVVVGYGSVSKRDITGAVSVVKSADINNMPVRSVVDILQGKTSGVTVSQSSGAPGSSSVVRIRGIGSIHGSTDPLYIVDGLPQTDINYLNPNDIETIAVHKDASVAAIYGSRASNGVIIITTKSGSKNDRVTVSYDAYYGLQSPWKRPYMLSASEFITYKNIAAENAGAAKAFDFSTAGNIDSVLRFVGANSGTPGVDWWKEIINYQAPVQNHNLSISGGNRTVSFLSSFSYFDQKGIVKGSDYRRLSWRNNLNAKINKRVKLSTNLGLNYEDRHVIDENNPFTGTIFSSMTGDPITPVLRNGLNGVPSFLQGIYAGYEPDNPFSKYSGFLYSNKRNPVAQIERLRQNKYETLSIKAGLTADVELLKTLTFQSRGGMDLNRSLTNGFTPKYSLNAFDNSTYNTVVNGTFTSNYFVWENTLNYDQRIGDFRFTALGGVSAEVTKVSLFNASIQGLVNNDQDMRILNAGTINPAVSGYPYSNALNSYFGRLGFDYAGKYIIAANIRRDGSSRFSEQYRWGTFPSVSAAWRFTEEDFFAGNAKRSLTDGKLRASYGLIGNQNIASGAYLSTYGNSIYDRYLFGNTNTPYIGAGRLSTGNAQLQWETSKQLDIGLDLSFFENKFNLVVDYFDKRVENMLMIVPLPSALGFPNSPYSNAGDMQNKGWEFEMQYNQTANKFKYTISANLSTYRNTVTRLGNGDPIFATAHLGEVISKTEVGMPVGYYYGYVTNGIFQNGKEIEGSAQRDVSTPGDIRFRDLNGDDVLDANDRTMIGNPWPDFVYGLTANMSFSHFDMSVFFQGSQGNDVMNILRYDTESGTGYYNAPRGFLEKSWDGDGSTDRYHKISQTQGINNSVSDYFVEDGSYLRLKNIQLGYNLEGALLNRSKISRLRFYIAAQNLFTVTGYSGLDPEMGAADPKLTGIDQGYYPQARTFMFGVNANF